MPTDKRPLEARWPEVSRILDEVLELPVAARAGFIDRAVGDDTELRRIVERLLEADRQGDHFLGASAEKLASSLLEQTPEAIAQRLDRYEILGRLGSGSMGEVFEAQDRQLRRKVAIKVLAATHALNDKRRRRFLREARAASSVDHPNICTVHDIGESGEHLYIVMSRYDGDTLEARLRQGRLPVSEALDIARQITRGLACAHDAGVVHRDIKPANILLPPSGPVKILDFGIAKVLGETRLTRTDAAPGTLAYMAPEQIEGGDADVRADIWSVGVLLYQMLDGRLPFKRSGLGATVNSILHESPAPLAGETLTPGLGAVVAKALAKDPESRFPDARELLAALDDPTSIMAPEASSTGVEPPTGQMAARRGRSIGWLVGSLIALVLVGWAVSTLGPAVSETAALRVTVAPFENHDEDTSMAWLGEAIASMLSCDLAQEELLEVASGCGLIGESEPVRTSTAGGAGESHRVRGSYLSSGGLLRLDVSIDDAAGELVDNKVLQRDAEEILQLVADVGSYLRQVFSVPATGETWLASEAMTTASIEAWRYYQRALAMTHAGDLGLARKAFEAAIAEDPEFALALADFGLFLTSRGDLAQARNVLARAMNQGHRLPDLHRERVQAEVLASSWEGYGAAATILARLVERNPTRFPERNHLAAIYGWLEDYEAAAHLYDGLIADGTDHYATYESAASMHVALGRFDRAHQLLDELPPETADHWKLRWKRGWIWLEQGELDRARSIFKETVEIPEAVFLSRYELWRLAIVEQRWNDARAQAEAIIAASTAEEIDVFMMWWGETALARSHLFVGDAAAALAAFTRANEVAAGSAFAATSQCMAAELALARDDPESARALAHSARALGDQQWPWLQATALLALADDMLDATDDADRALAELAQRALNAGNPPELRLSEHLSGRLALQRGDVDEAIAALEKAVARLPPQGIEFHHHHLPDHVVLWFDLGLAYKRAGQVEQARTWFERVLSSGIQQVQAPLAWTRAHFHLATVHRKVGEYDAAADRYRQFLALRPIAGLDDDLVARARHALNEAVLN